MSAPHVLVLCKRTSYRTLVLEDKDTRIESLLARGDPTVRRLRRSHEDHEAPRAEVERVLKELRVEAKIVDGAHSKVDGKFDLVVTVGGDGTLLAASHRVGPDVPVLGINSAPAHSVGFFCAARKETARECLSEALQGTMKGTVLSRMRVDVNGTCFHKRVLNDALFCHEIPAATSRYILRVTHGDGHFEEEEQKSSGLWVGPAAGSTAAQRSAGGLVLPLTSRKVQYVVREPYTPRGDRLALFRGTIDEEGALVILNKMRHAKLFLDGHHIAHPVTVGDVITMRRSDETLTVLGLGRANGKERRRRSPEEGRAVRP